MNDNVETIKIKMEKERKTNFAIGIAFIISAIIFTIIAIAIQKYTTLIGVVLQIIAGIMLITNNKKRKD